MEPNWIAMRHQDHRGIARVAESAFETVFKKNGWERLSSDNATLEELSEAAGVLGKDVTGEETKEELDALLGNQPSRKAATAHKHSEAQAS